MLATLKVIVVLLAILTTAVVGLIAADDYQREKRNQEHAAAMQELSAILERGPKRLELMDMLATLGNGYAAALSGIANRAGVRTVVLDSEIPKERVYQLRIRFPTNGCHRASRCEHP